MCLLRSVVLIPWDAIMRNMYSVPASISFTACNKVRTTHHWLPALQVSFLDGCTPITYLCSTAYSQISLQVPLFHFGDWNVLIRNTWNECLCLPRDVGGQM